MAQQLVDRRDQEFVIWEQINCAEILNHEKYKCFNPKAGSLIINEARALAIKELLPLLANVCKLNVTRFPYKLARLATDVAGGLLGTMPSAADFENPLAGKYIRKYLAANPEYATVDRMKVLRLIESLVAGAGAVGYLIESMHGAGPPTAQRIMIRRQANIDDKIDRVKAFWGIK